MSADAALTRLQELDRDRLAAELRRCFGSDHWATAVADRAPFTDRDALIAAMSSEWSRIPREEWLAAIQDHPRIGESGSETRFAATRRWSRDEQAGVSDVDASTSSALARYQGEYEAKFGHVFLICATGKSGEEILKNLQERLRNDHETELENAAEELRKIASLRVEKLLGEIENPAPPETPA